MINCEINLILTWSKNFVLTDMITQAAVPAQENNSARPAINAPANATFKIEHTKLYVPVVTLSTHDDNIRAIKEGFKRTVKWNIYR